MGKSEQEKRLDAWWRGLSPSTKALVSRIYALACLFHFIENPEQFAAKIRSISGDHDAPA